MNHAFEHAPQQERESPRTQAAARLEELNSQRKNLGRLKKSADAASFIGKLQELKTEYQTLGREITAAMRAEASQKELTELRKLQVKARKQADKLSDRIKKMEINRSATATPRAIDYNNEDTLDDLSPEAQAELAEMATETMATETRDDNMQTLWEVADSEVYDSHNIQMLLAAYKAGHGTLLEDLNNITGVEKAITTQNTRLSALEKSRTNLTAERHRLEGIGGNRSPQEKARLTEVSRSLTEATSLESYINNAKLDLKQKLEVLQKQAAEAAELEKKRALAQRLVQEANRQKALDASAAERVTTSAERVKNDSAAKGAQLETASTEAAAEQARLTAEILEDRTLIHTTKRMLRAAERALAEARRDRALLEGRPRTRLETLNIESLSADISSIQEDIASKELTLVEAEKRISEAEKIILSLREKISASEEDLRFTPDPDANKRDQVTGLQREQAELAKSRERLAAAQAEAKVVAARVRADAENRARVRLAPSAAELRAAEISRRIAGNESRESAARKREADFNERVESYANRAVSSFDEPARRLDAQIAELTAKEAAILQQIENLEAGLGPDRSQELADVQKYLDLDNTGLNTIYTFMKIMEEDERIIGILPVDIASQVAGRTWTEIARDLQAASQKPGLMSRMWRSAFGDPNAKLKEALQAISELNPAELRRAANIQEESGTAEHRRRRQQGSRFLSRDSLLSNTNPPPFGGVSRW